MSQCRSASRRSFTLVELLVVIAVIAILAALLLPAVRTGGTSARAQTSKALIEQLGMAITQFEQITGALPTLISGVPSSNSLIQRLGTSLTLKDTFRQRMGGQDVIIDGFAQPVIYDPSKLDPDPGKCYYPLHNPKTYDLFSAGAYASHIPALGGSLPNDPTGFETAALARAGEKYVYEEYTVPGRNVINKYFGNW